MKFLKYPSTSGLALELSATKGAAETLVGGTVKEADREKANRTATLATANTQTAAATSERPGTVVKPKKTLSVAEECSVDAPAEMAVAAEIAAAAAAAGRSCSTVEPVVIVQ